MFSSAQKITPSIKILNDPALNLPAPINTTIEWNFMTLLGFCLVALMLMGALLAMFYLPGPYLTASEVIHISRYKNWGC